MATQYTLSPSSYRAPLNKNIFLRYCVTIYMQIYRCLQPLMVSYSHSGCIKLIDRLSEDHDIKVKFWCDELKDNFMVIMVIAS